MYVSVAKLTMELGIPSSTGIKQLCGHVGVNKLPVGFQVQLFLLWNWAYHSTNFIEQFVACTRYYPTASIKLENWDAATYWTLAQVTTLVYIKHSRHGIYID